MGSVRAFSAFKTGPPGSFLRLQICFGLYAFCCSGFSLPQGSMLLELGVYSCVSKRVVSVRPGGT